MRKRRKTRYTWLPTIPGQERPGDATPAGTWQRFFLDLGNAADPVAGVLPVLEDTPQDPATGEGIGEAIGNEYLLKRIVGKIFVHVSWTNNGTQQPTLDGLSPLIVTCGWFVSRADPANYGQPVAPSQALSLYSPQSNNLQREPWIWRRSWVLGVDGFGQINDNTAGFPASGSINGNQCYPSTNVAYGSVLDGPHVDARTGRRVRLEERLWFVGSLGTLYGGAVSPDSDITASASIAVDCRYLGAMRRPRGRSNFA